MAQLGQAKLSKEQTIEHSVVMALAAVWFLFAVVVFASWKLRSAQPSYRYKMTVEVMTPEGLRTGFAVREVIVPKAATWFPFGENRGSHRRSIGEAVAVDLPSGATLFALLNGARGYEDYASDISFRAIGPEKEWQIGSDPVELWPNTPPHPLLQRSGALPKLITFKEVTDPTSVELVDPNDLAAYFGEGVSLRRVTIEPTNQLVTVGLTDRLAKLGIKPNQSLDNDFKATTNPTLAQRLSYRHFKREAFK